VPANITIDDRDFQRMLKDVEPALLRSWSEAGEFYKKVTPVAPKNGGNAQSKTSTRGNVITADYGYAARLDEGWSKQRPQGMSTETVEVFESSVNQNLGKL